MDDQVPDLREGLFMDPVLPSYLDSYRTDHMPGNQQASLSGSPLAGGVPVFAILEIANLIGGVLSSLEIDLTLSNIVKLLKGIFINGCPFTAIPRLIGKIASGELSAWISAHRDSPIEEVVRDWIKDVMFDHLGEESQKRSSEVSLEYQNEPGSTPSPSDLDPNPGRDIDIGRPNSGSVDSPVYTNVSQYADTADYDVACVPVSYWKRLYAMGRAFQKRDAAPRFDNLQLTGAPATDLLLNRVPSIYVGDDGLPEATSWQYGTYPMAGGLFKKIVNGVKKVAKGVAKGVSKVMDSPLGSVISAIPVVGNVASVAGNIAKTATKVIDKIEGFTGSSDESDSEPEVRESGSGGVASHKYDKSRSSSTPPSTSIEIAALPTWKAPSVEKYQAPPVSLLSNDPNSAPCIRTQFGLVPILGWRGDVVSEDPMMIAKWNQIVNMRMLRDMGQEIESRGPQLIYRVIQGHWTPIAGDATSVKHSRAARVGGLTSYWAPHTRLTATRRVPIRLAGDPTMEEEKLRAALEKFAPMSTWASDPSLSSPGDDNAFAKMFFQLYSDGDLAPMFSGDSWGESALVSYALNCPFTDRMINRGVPVGAELAAAAVWAMYLVSSSVLNDSQRAEIALSMKSAAMAGLFKNKSIDQLQTYALNGSWPSDKTLREPKVGKNWTRMVALTILYIWNDASGSSSSPFSQAISSVSFPSIDAVTMMKAIMMERSKSASQQAQSTINADAASSKFDAQGKTTAAQADLISALSALGLDPEVAESGASRPFPLDDGSSATDGLWTDEGIGDLWFQAESICRRSTSESQARMIMNSLGIPSSIIARVLQRYYTSVGPDVSCGSRLSLIPLSRQDYLYHSHKELE
jgi:hypothetical protein